VAEVWRREERGGRGVEEGGARRRRREDLSMTFARVSLPCTSIDDLIWFRGLRVEGSELRIGGLGFRV
jgi:hypothetical protein